MSKPQGLNLSAADGRLKLLVEGITSHFTGEYNREYNFGDKRFIEPAVGIRLFTETIETASCVVIAAGNASRLTSHSAIIWKQRAVVCCGNRVFALKLPSLDIDWSTKVDAARCLGVYSVSDRFLLTRGECYIMRLSSAGTIEWRVSGRDIFSGKFHFDERRLWVSDFEGSEYSIDLSSGKFEIL